MDDGKLVWAPDPDEGFKLGKVVDIGTETISVEPLGSSGKVVSAPYSRVFPAEDDGNRDVDDNCALMYLNEATLLQNLKVRYKKDLIYTYVANILIAVNPYQDMKQLYTNESIKKYKGKSLGTLPPHVFAIADKAFRDMKVFKQSQSIVVSGESGAGKTESTKFILRYLAESIGSSGNLEKRIVEANPLLEAFGNAKTLRNTNSSRFGKYVEVHFSDKLQMVGGYISHYLLEKSRICKQNKGERNYHVFYRLCMSSNKNLVSGLQLASPDQFYYLNQGTPRDPNINDEKDFTRMEDAMNGVGMTSQERQDIYRIVAVVLHLGNITFEENVQDKKGGSITTPSCEKTVNIASKFLGVEPSELKMALTTRIMTTTKGGGMGTIYKVPLKIKEATAARDALAKAVYSKLFDRIVSRVNECFPFKTSSTYIGVLDIAGFEFFEINSFEQFCINYCNEKLQQFFNERILKEEQILYEKEGLGVKSVSYVDNQDCIDLIETKKTGILDLLDEESKLPKSTEQHFTSEVHQKHGKHFRLALPRKSPLSLHRNLRDDQGFLVRHFAGAVCYQTDGFLEKNNDALHGNLEALLHESQDPFIKGLFSANANSGVVQSKSNKLAFESVGKKFKTQLGYLMDKLRTTGSNFIRCIKPNDEMKSRDFEGGQILSQLQCAGMVSVLELMQQGFPSRTSFQELYNKYRAVLPPKLAKLDPRLFCKALFRAVGMNDEDFKFGMSKVFFRPGKFAEFDQIMHSDRETLAKLVAKVQRWIIQNRWKRAIWGAISVQKLANKIKYRRAMLVKIQKNVRMYLAVKRHQPRYRGIVKLKNLQTYMDTMRQLLSSLKNDKEKHQKIVAELASRLDQQIAKIKATDKMTTIQIDQMYNELFDKINKELAELKKKNKVQAEQDKLKQMQAAMDAEKKLAEEAEKKKKDEDLQRKQRVEAEVKMKKEAEKLEQLRQGEEHANKRLKEQLKLDHSESEYLTKQREEQERRDYELALRLASDSDSTLKPQDPTAVIQEEREPLKRGISTGNKKHDLRSWKYAQLRDTINTSCDIDLLEACRDEFHRRLKVYHAWRKRNQQKSKSTNAQPQRAPVDVIHNAEEEAFKNMKNEADKKKSSKGGRPQRYFRVPFARGNEQYRDSEYKKTGWWYAHFDGEWVARQLESHANGYLLLVSGKDDMDMCELSLSDTRLVERPGAEITEEEFNREWKSHGGSLAKFQAKQRK